MASFHASAETSTLGHPCACGADHDPAAGCGGWSRRGFLRTGVGLTAGLGLGAGFVMPSAALAQTQMTPDAALQAMMDGNKRFAQGQLTSFNDDLKALKEKTAESQAPFAAVLSCADSRVPVELVFDQTIGHLFVCRVAGNIVSPELIGSLEYGVAVLGAKALMVLGHSNCGAVSATIAAKAVPGQISVLYRSIRPAVDQAGPNTEAAGKADAKIQAGLLGASSPLLAEQVKAGQLKIVAALLRRGKRHRRAALSSGPSPDIYPSEIASLRSQ
jgi:carbonic anhydrase